MKNILSNRVTNYNDTALDFFDRNRYITEYIMVNYKRIPVNRYICISRLFSKDELPCIWHCGGTKKRTIRYLCKSGKLSRKSRSKRNIRDYYR